MKRRHERLLPGISHLSVPSLGHARAHRHEPRLRVRDADHRDLHRCLRDAEFRGPQIGCHLSVGRLHRHPVHLPCQRLAAAAREHQAALLPWHVAQRRVDGRDDVVAGIEPLGSRRGRALDGHVVRPLLVEPRFPGPFQHERFKPQLLLRPGEFLRHEPEHRRATDGWGVHCPLWRRDHAPGQPCLPDRHGRGLRAHLPGLGHCPPRPLCEPAGHAIHLYSLPLAVEPNAIAGLSQGDRPGLHRHRAGDAGDDPRGKGGIARDAPLRRRNSLGDRCFTSSGGRPDRSIASTCSSPGGRSSPWGHWPTRRSSTPWACSCSCCSWC